MRNIFFFLLSTLLIGCATTKQQPPEIREAINEDKLQGNWELVGVAGRDLIRNQKLTISLNSGDLEIYVNGKGFKNIIQQARGEKINQAAMKLAKKHGRDVEAIKAYLMLGVKNDKATFYLVKTKKWKDVLVLGCSYGEEVAMVSGFFDFVDDRHFKVYDIKTSTPGLEGHEIAKDIKALEKVKHLLFKKI